MSEDLRVVTGILIVKLLYIDPRIVKNVISCHHDTEETFRNQTFIFRPR